MQKITKPFQTRILWLSYLGLIPFLACTLMLITGYAPDLALHGMSNYAAVILTFLGAIHWGRALDTHDLHLATLSVIPSLIAWFSLFLNHGASLLVLALSYLLLVAFDYQAYRSEAWFRRLRLRLSMTVCGLLAVSWFAV